MGSQSLIVLYRLIIKGDGKRGKGEDRQQMLLDTIGKGSKYTGAV